MGFIAMTLRTQHGLVRGLGSAMGLSTALAAAALPVAGGELRVSRTMTAGDCPDERELVASTLALGRLPVDDSTGDGEGEQAGEPSAELLAEVELDRDEQGYVARIRSTGPKTGFRELRTPGESCAPLAEATSVALAILFDLLPPESETPTPPPLAQPGAPTEASEVAKPAATRPAESRASKPPPAAKPAYLAIDTGVAYGLLGDAVSWQLGTSVRFPLTRTLEAGAGALVTPFGRNIDHGPGTVSVRIAAGRTDVAMWFGESAPFSFGARLGGMIGALEGDGDDFDEDQTRYHLWLAAHAGVSTRLSLAHHIAMRFDLYALVPHRSHEFSVEGVPGLAYESLPLAGVFEFGMETGFF